MKQFLMTASDLFLLFLHLLIMQKCMTAFLGPGNEVTRELSDGVSIIFFWFSRITYCRCRL